MVLTCIGSFYFSFFIYVILHNFLFFVALKYSRGEVKALMVLMVMVDFIMLLTFPLLFMMTKGVCL
jgi:hypothetical protein